MSCVVVFVFFQEEDGIRDLLRARGRGDVYKGRDRVLVWARSVDRSPGRAGLCSRRRHLHTAAGRIGGRHSAAPRRQGQRRASAGG